MNIKMSGFLMAFVASMFFFSSNTVAQTSKPRQQGELYFSWGYNKEWYAPSTIKISQPELGNNYSFKKVKGHDRPGWDKKLFSVAITIPQYSYRLGYFFNDKKDLGIEINFDHTKFIFGDGPVRIKGTLNNKQVDTSLNFSSVDGFHYYLNNGANFLLFNIMKRWHWHTRSNENIKFDVIGKAGVGPVIPHVDNSFFGNANEPGFQIGGWNMGTELAIRSTFFKHVYLEFAGKLDYARYSKLKVYKGDARHDFGTGELILSFGYTLKTGRKR
ncbi:MAG: hypothetical protein H7Y03_00430 [Chitinophagaceae bacterium]|nr:hypothetical protein [Chitinophagaceae bacterium]